MNTIFFKPLLYFIIASALVGCCPPKGVNRSFTVDDYAIAVDYYSQGEPADVHAVPKSATTVEVFDKESQSEKPLYVVYDSKQNNRIIYYFNSTWSSEKINSLNIKLGDTELNNYDFNSIEKSDFQRESKPYLQQFSNTLSYLDQIECVIKSVAEIILPRAQAMSCKPSADSVISYRAGTLIRINLN